MFSHGQYEGIVRNSQKWLNNDETKGEMYFDLGAYGVPRVVRKGLPFDGPEVGRRFGQFAIENRGFQLLYADVFITRAEFGRMFQLELYEKMRIKYEANGAFPHVWDKIKPQITIN
jgi:delta24-sterol reductase